MTSPFSLFRFLLWIIFVSFQTIKSFLVLNKLLPPPHFPLFRVPYVPLGRIIDFMDPDALRVSSYYNFKSSFSI
ncbi:hypothetical protein CRE_16503 [Caenorhabditis remanei]|uniref:F-box domain-containing protein n=1 Tax=Caenorhabditis remanei TaxID=31234 RepID=E3NM82_CAERE|nr:hypothetical protein CRE_16503 [Caenorhabditis remanei]